MAWVPMLKTCRENCDDPCVVEFAVNALKNLESLTVDDKFVAVYFGETGVTLDQRMRYNDLMEFLSWFPVTHISKLFQVKPNTLKRLRKDVTYVMEAFIAVLWESKLSDCINL